MSPANPSEVTMNEQEILAAIAKADKDFAAAKEKLSRAKRVWLDAETIVIETKLARDRLRERLRVYRNITPTHILDLRELDIEGFRERNPGMVEFARQRDETGEND